MAATEAHGSKAKFYLGTTDISEYLTSVELGGELDTAEVSALGDTNKQYVVGLQDASISVEGNLSKEADAAFTALFGQTVGTAFKYFPVGSAAGLRQVSGSVYMSEYSPSTPVDDKGSFSSSFVAASNFYYGTVI